MSLQNTVLFGAVLVFTAALILTLNSSQMHQSKHSIFLATLPMVGGLELDDLWGSFQFKPFHDSMTLCIHPCVISVIKQRSTALFPSGPAIWWRMLQLLLWTLWSHIPPPRTHHEPQKGSVGGCGNGEVGGWEAKGPGTSTGPISAWEVSPSHRQVDLETSPKVNLTPSPSGYYSTISNHASFPHSSYQT